MKIVQYCQHVLGVGHLFRSLEISRALSGHDIVMVTGGEPVAVALPDHVRLFQLPPLKMDEDFSGLQAPPSHQSLDDVRRTRQALLWDLFVREAPDLFLVELYPFGRKAFRFELDPVLAGIADGKLPPCRVVSSIRDILVEKSGAEKHEKRVVKTLHRFFERVLVHADPRLVTLAETFDRFSQIRIPVHYTGFVAPRPNADAAGRMRARLGVPEGDRLVVISAGAGQAGWPLLQAAVAAAGLLAKDFSTTTLAFTGPFLDGERFDALCARATPSVRVSRFFSDFLELLASADLSVSMGGYNTTMNILAARVPALVWPFPQNREQGMRAGRLADLGLLGVLSEDDLAPGKLAARMRKTLARGRPNASRIDLDGAEKTADILLSGMLDGQGRGNKDDLLWIHEIQRIK